ncbi:MAG: amino acid adenylation domain-containing protein [Clostridia bacterium]|nr:amino acid adenylation domain-containing protein [Clostridia bacterium]
MILQKYLENSAQRYGEKTAVRYRDEAVTYRQLNMLANQVANTLISQGLAVGDKVGLYLSKSIEAVAAIFGILKAGAVYVPLDPDSPLERTRYIISNCSISTIVVDDFKLQKLVKNQELFPEKLLLLNMSKKQPVPSENKNGWKVLSRTEIEDHSINTTDAETLTENDLAYILYTSGSTGQPKGVMLTHLNGSVFVDWAADYLNLRADDIFSSHAPFHFDLSIFDIFVSIKLGATLCLIPPGISYFPDAILKYLYENKITVWYSVPSALIQLLSLKDDLRAKLQSVNTLIYAGEVFPYQYLNKLGEVLTETDVYNFYGPTETNVITYYKVELQKDKPLEENVPIGMPCPYAEIRIVDENMKPVPPGGAGELIVNGSSLMSGYWGDAEKSARAVRKVTGEKGEAFFYFTGDWVAEREDGSIIYINRRDNMVKTRGFRVELGEIETALYKHSSVQKASVVAIPDEKIGHRIIAFVDLKKGSRVLPDEMEKHCEHFLPAYMLPEKIIVLQELPLSANGKIDREKLKELYQKF